MFDVYWGSWIRTNEMTESKSVALPLGYTPLTGRGRTRPYRSVLFGRSTAVLQRLKPAGCCNRSALLSCMIG